MKYDGLSFDGFDSAWRIHRHRSTRARSVRPVISRAFVVVVLAYVSGCESPIERTVAYDPRFGEATTMDVFSPRDDSVHPAVLFFHGGAWKMFSKRAFQPHARRFAAAGYVAFTVNYRLVPEGRFPNAVRDAACALAYVQNHAAELHVDPERIVVMGYSAGAQLAGLLAVAPDEPAFTADCDEGTPAPPRAAISISGAMDMSERASSDALVDYLGGTVDEIPEVYVTASPITYVTADDPPFLFVHGSNDLLVPISVSVRMQDALEAVGVEASLLELRGGGHIGNFVDAPAGIGFAPPYDSTAAWIAIVDFLDEHTSAP